MRRLKQIVSSKRAVFAYPDRGAAPVELPGTWQGNMARTGYIHTVCTLLVAESLEGCLKGIQFGKRSGVERPRKGHSQAAMFHWCWSLVKAKLIKAFLASAPQHVETLLHGARELG